eukprot:211973-Pleurochrysis_carterae.AAC.1
MFGCRRRWAESRVMRGRLGGQEGRPAFVCYSHLEACCDGGDVEHVSPADHQEVATEPDC